MKNAEEYNNKLVLVKRIIGEIVRMVAITNPANNSINFITFRGQVHV